MSLSERAEAGLAIPTTWTEDKFHDEDAFDENNNEKVRF